MAKMNAEEMAAAMVVNALVEKFAKTSDEGRKIFRAMPADLQGDLLAIDAEFREQSRGR
jgi:hypothetical protein